MIDRVRNVSSRASSATEGATEMKLGTKVALEMKMMPECRIHA